MNVKKTERRKALPSEESVLSVCFLLKGCADGICAGVCVAGAYVDLFRGAGGGAVVINTVCHIAGNAIVGMAGFTGLFVGVHGVHKLKILSGLKNYERIAFFRYVLFDNTARFMR